MESIYEWCPYCEEEVELKAIFEPQICPNCGEQILPCCMCENCTPICPLTNK